MLDVPFGLARLDASGRTPADRLPDGSGGTTDWSGITNRPTTFPPVIGSGAADAVAGNDSRMTNARTPTAHSHAISDTTGLQTALDGKAATSHTHAGVYEPANANVQQHVASAHAPADAQRNADITKAEIEARLTGVIASHSHTGGADPWTVLALAADFTTGSATAVDVPGLAFTPLANTRYMVEVVLFLRTATATVNPRPGFAWASGLTDGVMSIDQSQTATTQLMARGNIAAALLMAVGGLPNTTQSWPTIYTGAIAAGASPSGQCRVQLASETASTIVRATAASYLRYRTY